MTLVELKKSIHDKIDDLNDPEFLELVNSLITNKGKVFEIPAAHLTGIEQGIEEIANGYFITLEEFEKRYAKSRRPLNN